jgi:hypothetical protein
VSLFLAFLFSCPLFAQSYGDLPLSFEPNLGQTNSKVQFLSHGKGYGFFLTGDTATLQLGTRNPRTVELNVANGQSPAKILGEAPLPGTANYFRGGDEARWLRNVPTYARVRMTSVYPGVDLVYYGDHRQLEYDFVVHPGANAVQVALTEQGASALKLSADGALMMQVGESTLHWHAPIAYQDIGGHRFQVAARYEIAGSTIRFHIGEYDHTHDLVIDPVLIYSTYLGGNGGADGDVGNAIAADSAGNAYVAGIASSTDFPTTSSAMQPASAGNDDAFVAKLNPQGTAFIYSTYLGGGGQDIAWGIAIDAAGEAFITGQTGSGLHGTAPFPTTAGAYQRTPNPATLNNSGFIAKLSADGSNLLYSTYLSGANDSFATGIAVDPAGDAYVVTNTASGFPVSSGAYQEAAGTDSCPYEQFADGQAQAVTELNPDGSALVYSTYVGHGCDYGSGIAVNSSGEAYITGYTQDSTYPITTGAAQSKFGGVVDAFVTKLNAAGNGLMYSTFLGGSLADFGYGIALDPSGYAYVTGASDGNFPTTSGAYDKTVANNGYRKGFVTKMSPLGKAFVYSTYVADAGNVSFNAIAVDKGNNAHVTGYTDGKQYPVTSNAAQDTCYPSSTGCLTQAVVTKLNPTGSALVYSSYFGASDATNNYFPGNIGNGIAVDNAGGFYITGRTSNGLKTTTSAVEPTYRATSNSTDAFVAKFNIDGTATTTTTVTITSPANDSTMASTSVDVSGSASGGNVGWMQIYVNGVRQLQVAGSTIHDTLTLSAGQRRITVQAIDKDGSVAKSTVYVTIK